MSECVSVCMSELVCECEILLFETLLLQYIGYVLLMEDLIEN